MRTVLMSREMADLAGKYQPAHERFAEIRNGLEPKVRGGTGSLQELSDWVVLNEVLTEEDRTLEWFDRVKEGAAARGELEKVRFRLQDLLIERGRWADLGYLHPEPMDEITAAWRGHFRGLFSEDLERRQIALESLAEKTAILYVAMLAAGRDEQALAVLETVAKGFAAAATQPADDHTAEIKMACVKLALEAGQAREHQLEWLSGAADGEGTKLRAQVEAALTDSTQPPDHAIGDN